MIATHELPDQAVIERELIDAIATDAVNPRVADVRDQCAFRQQEQGRAGRAHALEIAIGQCATVDQRAHVAKRFGDRLRRRAGPGLHIIVRNQVACHLAGKLPDRVSPHPVGDEEDVSALPPSLGVGGAYGRVAILIVRTTQARVSRGGVDYGVFPVHSLTLFSCDESATTQSPGGSRGTLEVLTI